MIFSRIILESTSLRNMTLLTWSIALFQYLLSYSALSCLIGVPEPTHRRMRARLRILCCPSPTGECAPDSGFYVVPKCLYHSNIALLITQTLLLIVLGTLDPSIQDSAGRPKRDINTILQILNDLLVASPKFREMPPRSCYSPPDHSQHHVQPTHIGQCLVQPTHIGQCVVQPTHIGQRLVQPTHIGQCFMQANVGLKVGPFPNHNLFLFPI